MGTGSSVSHGSSETAPQTWQCSQVTVDGRSCCPHPSQQSGQTFFILAIHVGEKWHF